MPSVPWGHGLPCLEGVCCLGAGLCLFGAILGHTIPWDNQNVKEALLEEVYTLEDLNNAAGSCVGQVVCGMFEYVWAT